MIKEHKSVNSFPIKKSTLLASSKFKYQYIELVTNVNDMLISNLSNILPLPALLARGGFILRLIHIRLGC